jgi:hypothetical protein
VETVVDPLQAGVNHAELGDSGRVAFTWWDEPLGRTLTAVYDVESGEEVARGLEDDVTIVGLPNGDILSASASRLNRSTGALESVHSLAKPGVAPLWMEASSDGGTLLVASWDHRVSLYDLDDARRLGDELRFEPDPNQYWPAGFISADGTMMATNTRDGVLVWTIDPATLRDAACEMVGRDFTELEWRTYFGDDPYVATCAGAARAHAVR